MKKLEKQFTIISLPSVVISAFCGGVAFYIDKLPYYLFYSYFGKLGIPWVTEITHEDMTSNMSEYMYTSAIFFFALAFTFPFIIAIYRLKIFKPFGDKIDKFLQPFWEIVLNQPKHVRIIATSIVMAIFLPLDVYWIVENFKKIVFPVPVHVIFLITIMLISTFSMIYLKRRYQMLILFCTCLMFVPWSFMFANEVTNMAAQSAWEDNYRLSFECDGERMGNDPHDFLFFRGQKVIIMRNSKTGQFKKYETNKVSKEVLMPVKTK